MEDFFIYLAKSTFLIAVFYSCHAIFLSRETFFKHNRVFQLFGVLMAFILPLIFITNTVYIAPAAYDLTTTSSVSITPNQVTKPINWWFVLGVVYAIGVVVFFIRFIIQLLSLRRIVRKSTRTKANGLIMVETSDATSPFSFFNYIVYNPEMYSETDLKTVIDHEKIHVYQKHSIDQLLMHLVCIVQWFNPFAWLYKKTVSQNLEYLADQSAAAQLGNTKSYQYLLVNQSISPAQNLTIINPFFNSLIKKRIIMLNQKKSKRINTLKFGLVLPLLAVFLFTINIKTVAQTKKAIETAEVINMKFSFHITKDSSDDELTTQARFIIEENDIELKFFKIKRNENGEITRIKSTFKGPEGNSGTYNISSSEPIKPFSFDFELNGKKKIESIGYGIVEDAIPNSTLNYTDIIKGTDKNGNISEVLQEKITQNIELERSEESTWVETKVEFTDSDSDDTLVNFEDYLDEDLKEPIFIIDEEIIGKDFSNLKLKYSQMKSIHISSPNESEAYGVNGKDGVIMIKTKKEK